MVSNLILAGMGITIVVLIIVAITAVPYYAHLLYEQDLNSVKDMMTKGDNELGRVIVDSINRLSTDKGIEHGSIDDKLDKIIGLLNDTK